MQVQTIRTVTGDIAPGDLGYCQTHEHIWCDYRLGERGHLNGTVRQDPDATMLYDEKDRMLDELRVFHEMGGRAIVDVTTSGWRPDLDTLRELSEASGVKIIATGGFYVESTIPRWVDDTSIREIADHLVAELNEGTGPNRIKVGLFKSAISRGRIERAEMKGLRAVARAILETGAAMTTHTDGGSRYEIPGGTIGVEHIRVFEEEGVPAHRLIVGHVDERPDVGVLAELAGKGCYIQFDVIGKLHWLLDETRAHLIGELRDRGYLDRILIGTDRCRKAELYRELGGSGYTYPFEHFFEILGDRGKLAPSEIDVITAENPARALAFEA